MIITINDLLNQKKDINQVTVNGWVRSNRNSSKVGFLDLNDGTAMQNLQVVYKAESLQWKDLTILTTGSAVSVTGKIVLTAGKSQPFELQLDKITIFNMAVSQYPIQKKEHTHEFLRDNAHLRPRTSTFLAIFKIRNQVSWSIHNFFHQENFIYLHSPIITANDAEGAGENFIVTTRTDNKYQQDFFSKKASLTVSGQLNAEAYAQSLQKVYTFGPTFRAENSNTSRHAAEFWMIEPEFTFVTLQDNMELAEKLVKSVINDILVNCSAELEFLQNKIENNKNLLSKLKLVATAKFVVKTYDEVIELLLQAQAQGHEFIFKDIKWGIDLQSEHEKYLCEEVTKLPTFVINYPQDIKAFYMKLNQDSAIDHRTVAAMDLLVPGIGELIGGSQREDNYEQLLLNKKKFKLDSKDLEWYFDLRKYGYAPSAGFGLGLERLIMFLTGISNIRDVIPFPRTPNSLLF